MPLPILMYHKVGAPVSAKADSFLNVSARSFGRQIRLLKRMGYEGLTVADATERLFAGRPLPRRPVCVTFDDGYCCVEEFAAPILRAEGWLATIFVPTGYVGGANEWDREAGRPILPIMDWAALNSLQDVGWELAGHTRTHPHLNELADSEALADIESGRDDLKTGAGRAPRTFCYPFGGINDRTPHLVRKAGFAAACTTQSGAATAGHAPFLLPRVKIGYRDDVLGFLYRLVIRPRL